MEAQYAACVASRTHHSQTLSCTSGGSREKYGKSVMGELKDFRASRERVILRAIERSRGGMASLRRFVAMGEYAAEITRTIVEGEVRLHYRD
jgi:hypothetical protein